MSGPNGPYLIWCGSDPQPDSARREYKKVITLDTYPGEGNVYLQFENIASKLVHEIPDLAMDMLEVGAYVYCADQAVSRGGKALRGHGRDWYRHFDLSIPVRNPDLWNGDEVRKKLSDTLQFLTGDYWDFEFRQQSRPVPQDSYFHFDEGQPWFEAEQVLMFSGGLDSLAGLVEEAVNHGSKVALVSHRPVGKIDSRQKNLIRAFAESTGRKERLLHVPVWLNKESGLTCDASQRARSFMYTMLGAVVAVMHNLARVRLYENGIVSINLPFSDQIVGATASRSTHPRSLRAFSDLLSALLGRSFTVENPFLWKTKSEVVKVIKDGGLTDLVRSTNSCTHVRTMTVLSSHCGVCSQCIERRLAALYNGLDEDDPAEMYKVRLFTDSLQKPEQRVMVESYMRHAMELEEMDEFQFFGRFPMVERAVSATGLPVSQAAEYALDLHVRHGKQVCSVIEDQVKRHAREIGRRELRPFSLLSMLVSGAKRGKAVPDMPSRFPTPEGTAWRDISIEIISDESATIKVADVSKIVTGVDMGFRDARRGDRLNKQWDLLTDFAVDNGVINWSSQKTVPQAQKKVQALKKTLQGYFGIPGPPISNYSKKFGYSTHFRISDHRGQM